jgi:protein phosphatase
MKIRYASKTDKGITRDHNEDCFLNHTRYALFLLADGMGGYQYGDVASKLTLDAIVSYLETCAQKTDAFSERAFHHAIDFSNRTVFNHKKKNTEIKQMGSTLVAFVPSNQGAMAFNVGDSRLYCFKNGQITQITKDHSSEQETLPEFMQNVNQGKFSSILSRAIGPKAQVFADAYDVECKKNDLFLLCSDGLHSMVSDAAISEILGKDTPLSEKCTLLIDAANKAGGQDNITVTLIGIENADKLSALEIIAEG